MNEYLLEYVVFIKTKYFFTTPMANKKQEKQVLILQPTLPLFSGNIVIVMCMINF